MLLDAWWRFRASLGRRPRRYRSRPLSLRVRRELNVRQEDVPGFSLRDYQAAHILVIGTGGIGTLTLQALSRKGIGRLTLLDDDVVEWSNLSRQLFDPMDVGQLKAHCAARALAKSALFPVCVDAYPWRWQEYVERIARLPRFDLIICGVDNNPTRRAVARFARRNRIPTIFAAVARDAGSLYTFVQEPHQACWGCAFPQYLTDDTYPCAIPAIIDVLNVTAGLIVYAVDSLISTRVREWNSRQVYLHGALPDVTRTIPWRPDCPICATPPPLPVQQPEKARATPR